MNSKSKMLGILAAYALAGAMVDESVFDRRRRSSFDGFDENNVSGKKAGEASKQGMKRFVIEGEVIYALNRKNAIRKANKSNG